MSWQRVRLIFQREIRDQLRDRRTLFMIAVLPLVLYPALGIGVIQMTLLLREEQLTVVVLNADALPAPPLVQGDRFAETWFETPEETERLRVVSVGKNTEDAGTAHGKLANATRRLAAVQIEYNEANARKEAAENNKDAQAAARASAELARLEEQRGEIFEESGIQVLLVVPPDLKSHFTRMDKQFQSGSISPDEFTFPTSEVLYSAASEKGRIALSRVEDVYRRWKSTALAEQLEHLGLPPTFAEILDAEIVDVADQREHAQSIWSTILPGLLVLMTLTGAFYPAIDLAAGEKERGTMETLLICPASRREIVVGKFLTIASFAVCTAILNLISMGLTGQYLASAAFGDAGPEAMRGLLLPPLTSIFWVGILLVPIAALFSALCLALATFARSTKEGQYYLTPILLVTVGLTMFAQMPTVELNPLNSVIPVTGVVLLLKGFLGGDTPYVYLLPVLTTSFGYAALAIWWAVEQFQREDVLFRESEQFEPRLWLRKLLREKQDVPSIGAAGFCFLVIMLLQFGAMRLLAGGFHWDPESSPGIVAARLLIAQQVLIIAAPALLLGLLLTSSLRKTFRWRVPHVRFLIIGVILPLAIMPLSSTLAERTEWFFPEPPESVTSMLQRLFTDEIPFGLLIVAFAVAPAICEELAFRGFILSGFRRSGRDWLAIGVSSFLFGLMHMIPQQAFNAALLGLVLGLLAVRSKSLWPCVLFHFVFNGSVVLQQRYPSAILRDGFPWWLLLICFTVASILIVWLVGIPRRQHPRPALETSSPSSPQSLSRLPS